ncbi:alpha/beta fold hydrolase [Kribbella italica]|uniref:Pimeloyl-ACP methyl ester carboxylesterase n=1 Tax=Kribbella italica TaxID=1540520 RepID=A0A7W9JH52_9ACTN|nr:alpha/beta hydrolase [Kribbella italica]MBB5841423.1 pimeloyl-ACP methyl ester carboxylesterase [Kribbella italica]
MTEPEVYGESGPVVLVLPGGAEGAEGFFPGLVEGLLDDPGCRVVVHDRPGTGSSVAGGNLTTAARDLHRVTQQFGPVVVVGQSLGGAVATLFARDHPEDVAGLVLVDSTPLIDPVLSRRVELVARATGFLGRVPIVRDGLAGLMRRSLEKTAADPKLRPDCAEAFRATELDFAKLERAVRGLGALSEGFDPADLPKVPAVVITADRKATSAIRRSHERLAEALGAELVSWPGATHSAHLTHPDEVLAVTREVVRQTLG